MRRGIILMVLLLLRTGLWAQTTLVKMSPAPNVVLLLETEPEPWTNVTHTAFRIANERSGGQELSRISDTVWNYFWLAYNKVTIIYEKPYMCTVGFYGDAFYRIIFIAHKDKTVEWIAFKFWL